MYKLFILSLIILCNVMMDAEADDSAGGYLDSPLLNCHGSSQVEYNDCVYRALGKSDQELNVLYKRLLKSADEEEKRYLQQMQQAWIKLRDAQCELILHYHVGAANPSPWKTLCKAVMTQRRVQELNQLGTGILWSDRGSSIDGE